MTGDHHDRTARRGTLLVTAADEILGTHRSEGRYCDRLIPGDLAHVGGVAGDDGDVGGLGGVNDGADVGVGDGDAGLGAELAAVGSRGLSVMRKRLGKVQAGEVRSQPASTLTVVGTAVSMSAARRLRMATTWA